MASRFRYVVEVDCERTEGKFASREELAEQIQEALEGADPGQVDGVGSDGMSSYEIIVWEVTEQEPAKLPRRRRTA